MKRCITSVILLSFVLCIPALAVDEKRVLSEAHNGLVFVVDSSDDSVLDVSNQSLYKMLVEEKVRVRVLENKVYALENTSPINPSDTRRIQELERIVRGLQKQVTILHGKKADKVKAQEQQGVPLVDSNTETTGWTKTVVIPSADR